MNISPVWNQNQGQTVPYAWKCPKTQFWGPLTNWKFENTRTHTLAPSSINTQNRSKNYVWVYRGEHWALYYRSKLSIALKSRDLATCGFPKIPDTPTKTCPVSERSAHPLQNYICFAPRTSWLVSFGYKSTCTPSDRLRLTVQSVQNSS